MDKINCIYKFCLILLRNIILRTENIGICIYLFIHTNQAQMKTKHYFSDTYISITFSDLLQGD